MFNGFKAQDVDLPTGCIHYCMGGAGDAVLLKASLSTNMRKVVDALQELGHPPMDNKGP